MIHSPANIKRRKLGWRISVIKGKIKGIGLFNTTLVSLDGLYVSAPNSTLSGNPIVNFSKNATRRLEIVVGIDYGDSTDKALSIMREMVEEEPLP